MHKMCKMVLLLTLSFFLLAVEGSVPPNQVSVSIVDAPYQVSITLEYELSCSGSIVSPNYVLTAAHCIAGPDLPFKVHSGSNVWRQGNIHNVSQAIVHEKFEYTEQGTPINDIALLRVDPPFTFDETTQPAELFNANRTVIAGEVGLVTTWDIFEAANYYNILQSVSVEILDRQICKDSFISNNQLSEDQICTANSEDLRNMCYGDSGAPLMINGQQAGIVSWSGPGCDYNKYPGVYTDIAYHRFWIDEHILA